MAFAWALGLGTLFAVWHSFADALSWRIYTAYYSRQRKSIRNKVGFILSHPSQCEACAARVPWYALVPIAGYFFVKGRCARCTRKISLRFPLFETFAFAFGALLGYKGIVPQELFSVLLVYLLLWVVIAIDYRMLLIPTEAILGLLLVGLFDLLVVRYPVWRFEQLGGPPQLDFLLDLAVSFVWYFFFHLLRILSGYKMGLADVRLVLALSFLLGHPFAIYLPGLAAALAIGFYLLRRRSLLIYAPSETEIPFGVFLSFGYFVLYLTKSIVV